MVRGSSLFGRTRVTLLLTGDWVELPRNIACAASPAAPADDPQGSAEEPPC